MSVRAFSRLIGAAVAALTVAGLSHAQSPADESPAPDGSSIVAAVDRNAATSPSRCTGWALQAGPASDTTGFRNNNFDEASTTTYWYTALVGTAGQTVTVKGQFPFARFMAVEVYTYGSTAGVLIDNIADVDIVPDPGQNNPYVSGTINGTYTVKLVFGPKPAQPAQNTIYTGTNLSVSLLYRIYHATNANDPAGGAALPAVWVKGQALVNCPVIPFLADPLSTPWGRLASSDFIGSVPTAAQQFPATNPPTWTILSAWDSSTHFPNGADSYMSTHLSREFLAPNTDKNLFVVRYRLPTFPDTRAGEPVYLDRQVHFTSICTDDPYTTNVNRCVPDDETVVDANGFATFVVCDPGSLPSARSMQAFSATWVPWGALDLPTDVVYDREKRPWGISTPVHYYNVLMIRQTDANPTFTQSYTAIAPLPAARQQAAMGDYWPVGGYCSTADFNRYGAACVGK
jgi:hypothetical protein